MRVGTVIAHDATAASRWRSRSPARAGSKPSSAGLTGAALEQVLTAIAIGDPMRNTGSALVQFRTG